MKKLDFLLQLHDKLLALPKEDMEERLAFYNEIIDDRMEEGLSEEEAVSKIGTVEEVAAQILADTPLSRLVMENIRPKKRLRVWEIVLLAVGSPLWLSLLIAVFAVVIALYAVLWAVVICLWSVFVSVGTCALAGIAAGIVFVLTGDGTAGTAMIAAALVCAGLAIFLFYGCKGAAKGAAWLTKQVPLLIKRCFIKKEAA